MANAGEWGSVDAVVILQGICRGGAADLDLGANSDAGKESSTVDRVRCRGGWQRCRGGIAAEVEVADRCGWVLPYTNWLMGFQNLKLIRL